MPSSLRKWQHILFFHTSVLTKAPFTLRTVTYGFSSQPSMIILLFNCLVIFTLVHLTLPQCGGPAPSGDRHPFQSWFSNLCLFALFNSLCHTMWCSSHYGFRGVLLCNDCNLA